MHYKVFIIGSGPAGLTAALYAARANLSPVVIRGLQPGGLIATTDEVENYPGFPDAVNGFDLADKMEKQAARFGTTFIDGLVTSVKAGETVNGVQQPHEIVADNGEIYTADTIIIATGASPRKMGVPGEDELANRGVSYCAVCDGFFFKNKRIAVVGGGNSAVEEGLFLTRFASEVVLVHRRDSLRADPIIQERAFKNPKLSFQWNAVVDRSRRLHKGRRTAYQACRYRGRRIVAGRCGLPIHRTYSEHVDLRGPDQHGREWLHLDGWSHTHVGARNLRQW